MSLAGGPTVVDPTWTDSPGRTSELLGRLGLGAYGAVHLLLAWLAASIAALGGHAAVDPRGAVAIVAHGGLVGRILLGVATVCLLTFAAWQVRAAVIGFRWVDGAGLRWRKRVGALAKALGVGSVAYLAVRFLLRSPGDRRDFRVLVSDTFAVPGGRLLIGLGAGVVLVTAVATAVTGVRATFLGDLLPERLTPRLRLTARWLGSVGNLTRAVGFGAIGVLALDSAVYRTPDEVGGLDQALRTLAQHTLGAAVLALAAVGFAAYGLYCLVDAWARHP